MSWAEQTPHLIHVSLTGDEFPEVVYAATCPHDGRGDDRWCKWGTEAPGCEWAAWEEEGHHPACPDRLRCDWTDVTIQLGSGETRVETDMPACWDGRDRPQECGGFTGEFGHGHPIEGVCAVTEALGIGMGEAVRWGKGVGWRDPLVIDGPIEVLVSWEDGVVQLDPVDRL